MAEIELNSSDLIGDADLVSYYRFENSLNDEKGTNNLTDNGSTNTASGKFGQARNFEADSTQYAKKTTATHPTGNSAFSISLWVNLESTGVDRVFFAIGVDGGSPTAAGVYLEGSSGKFAFSFASSNGKVLSSTIPSTGTWYYVVGVYDTSSTKIYVNGVLENTTTYSSGNLSAGDLNVGSWVNNAGVHDGDIDDAAIFSKALTAEDINYLYSGSRQGGSGFYYMSV